MATRVVIIRAWKTLRVLNIDLVARGSRTDPPTPLICAHYETNLSSVENVLFLRSRKTLSIDTHQDAKQGTQITLDSWGQHVPDLCLNIPVFACHIAFIARNSTEMPVGSLFLILHYIRLRTLMEAKLEEEGTFDFHDNLLMLLERFDSFIAQRIKELDYLGKMLSID
ncbi:MAG: hypothetical protein HYS60_00635 [Candidatus Wildermuthbacteria bacterium]|nr:hypothetical protein [Candidatus Wildermuthbacteria bacterium]